MHTNRLTTLDDLASVREAWNTLARGVPLRSWEWLEAWWRTYGTPIGTGDGPRELFVLVVRHSTGDIVGIAPWYVEAMPSQQRVVRFLGSGEVCTDHATVLCRPGFEEQVAAALAAWLDHAVADRVVSLSSAEAWDCIELDGVSPRERVIEALSSRLEAGDHLVRKRRGPSCWRIPLPATWDEYLGMLSKSHRKQVRRCERRMFDTGRAVLREVSAVEELDEGLELLARLHQRRRRSFGKAGSFASPRFAAFHRLVAARLLERGQLGLYWLELDGRAVAAEYHLFGGGAVYAYQSGIEPDSLEFEPGRLITLATVKQAIENGVRDFDFLRGDERYKAHWRAVPTATQNLHIVSAAAASRLRHRLWLAGDNVKSWIKNFTALGASNV